MKNPAHSRQTAEVALRVADHVDVMLGYWDRDLRCRFANAAYQTWFGKGREELLGSRIQDLLGPLFDLNEPYIRGALRGEFQMFERQIPLPDGTQRQSLACYYPDIRDGVVQGFFVQVTNVSRLKEVELKRLHQAMQIGRMYAFEWNPRDDSVLRAGDAELLRDLHLTDEDTGDRFLANVHPGDRETFREVACGITAKRPSYEISYRFVRENGTVLWLKERGQGFFDANGTLERVVGMAADVTETKEAEETLRRLGRRLLSAQELERKKIARELHDDIGQDLAALAIELAGVQGDKGRAMELHVVQKRLDEIGAKVRTLSHQLHSAALEHVGIAAAVQSLCREFRRDENIHISCTCSDVPVEIESSVALALYRVAQEALRNVKKHAEASRVVMELAGRGGGVSLIIADNGRGFVPGRSSETGLGLISMRERIQAVGGEFSIRSDPGEGTTVEARVKHLAHR